MSDVKDRVNFYVLLGPSNGNEPDPWTDEVLYLRPERISWFQGGQRLDSCRFRYDLDVTGEHVENLQTPTGWARQVEVRIDLGGGLFTPMFWGDLTLQDLEVAEEEDVHVTAAIFPYHFGKLLYGPYVWDPIAAAEVTLLENVTINPLVDGVVEGNRSSKRDANDNHYLWGDPESFRTSAAETLQGETLSVWTLAEAIEALIWRCNPDETYFKNPTQLTDPELTLFDGAPDPYNETLPRGRHLPYYLDLLLPKYGYQWCVDLVAVDSGGGVYVTEKRIRIFKIGEGTEQTVSMQAFGSTALELAEQVNPATWTNCARFAVTTDVGNVANRIYADGGRKEYEVTIELYRGWSEADDALTEDDLLISDGDSQYHTGKDHVWRLWVANEAGDFCSTRTTVAPIPSEPRDWSTHGVKIPRRRKIEDCLTYNAEGKRRPPFVEYSDGETETVGMDEVLVWKPVPPGWTYHILETQMGIRFAGDSPPPELLTAGNNAKIRVTCTLVGDDRITGFADSSGNSPNARDTRLHIDLSDRYFKREIVTTGDYASVINNGSDPADTRDDESTLQSFTEYLRANAESADMAGRFELFGIETGYSVGDLLTKVAGREINLDRNSAAAASPKYLQIVGVEWDEDRQTTTLYTAPQDVDPAARPGVRPQGAAA